MSGLGQNIHLLHCAFVVHVEGSAADQVAVLHLQGYWFQSVKIEPRKVKDIKSGCKVFKQSTERHSIISETTENETSGVIFKEILINNRVHIKMDDVNAPLK